uniref:AlNc14C5G715 protein n=1 Tax=Albugo laibachii Nc14 TaxID=890382 RepID=F0W0T0_9STRA|nr:AlNc14C5G715 [Albugo laibachii Nc14]|eukprot:CCA14654.1 AlNc14C5G715 [Albugo laibachii Nc14]
MSRRRNDALRELEIVGASKRNRSCKKSLRYKLERLDRKLIRSFLCTRADFYHAHHENAACIIKARL